MELDVLATRIARLAPTIPIAGIRVALADGILDVAMPPSIRQFIAVVVPMVPKLEMHIAAVENLHRAIAPTRFTVVAIRLTIIAGAPAIRTTSQALLQDVLVGTAHRSV